MPCDSSYLGRSEREEQLQRAAKLLVFVRQATGVEPEPWALKQAGEYYAKDERAVTELCAALKGMDPDQRERIVYDAHNRDARDLADWWEDHQQADAEREEKEKEEKERKKLAAAARKKLSQTEREALGI